MKQVNLTDLLAGGLLLISRDVSQDSESQKLLCSGKKESQNVHTDEFQRARKSLNLSKFMSKEFKLQLEGVFIDQMQKNLRFQRSNNNWKRLKCSSAPPKNPWILNNTRGILAKKQTLNVIQSQLSVYRRHRMQEMPEDKKTLISWSKKVQGGKGDEEERRPREMKGDYTSQSNIVHDFD